MGSETGFTDCKAFDSFGITLISKRRGYCYVRGYGNSGRGSQTWSKKQSEARNPIFSLNDREVKLFLQNPVCAFVNDSKNNRSKYIFPLQSFNRYAHTCRTRSLPLQHHRHPFLSKIKKTSETSCSKKPYIKRFCEHSGVGAYLLVLSI